MANPFSTKGKIHGQTLNQFTIYQINYNNSCVCLTAKKNIYLLFFFAFTHTLFVSRRQQDFALSFLLRSSQAKIHFLSLSFTLYFPSPYKEDPWAKVIKFFVTLSIYKTLFLFSLELGIHYLFNKEFISSWITNTLPLS